VHPDDGHGRKVVQLNRPYRGLYICPMVWREIENCSWGAVCLMLASHPYSEDDYYWNYDEFVAAARATA
jgi:hypothetical protein